MFRLYEYNFSSTIELVTGVLLVVTILAVSFAADRRVERGRQHRRNVI